jgi:hypothetical protein
MAYRQTEEGWMPEETEREILTEEQAIEQELEAIEREEEEEIEEILTVSEELALHSIISEERHEEILEEVEQCRTQLESLSMGESPTLAAIQTQLTAIHAELMNQRAELEAMRTRHQSASTPSSPRAEELINAASEQAPAVPEVPEQQATPPPPARKRAKFI